MASNGIGVPFEDESQSAGYQSPAHRDGLKSGNRAFASLQVIARFGDASNKYF
jgi:hypothetical protein